jgi:hypothetical protein
MLFPALLAKLLSAGAIAQAATGAGVAVVVVCSAGAAGVLPDPVQETFSSIVGTDTEQTGTVDPAPVDDGTVDPAPAGDGSVDPAPVDEGTADDATDDTDTDFGPTQPLGPQIAGRVEHGEVDGRRVSDMAHERNDRRRNGGYDEDEATTPEAGDDTPQTGGDDTSEGGDDVTTQTDDGGNGRGGHGGHGNG